MSQSQKMRAALNKLVIPNLLDRGFVGKYPHYRKDYDDRVELLTFETNKYGNCFKVEISTVFLPSSKRDNNFSDSKNKDYDNATVWDTNWRYRLDGIFDGWFSYEDDEIYAKICDEVNRQMEDAYKWWDLFNKNPKKIIIRERFDEKIRQIKRFFR